MKIRIQGDTIRLRVNDKEVKELEHGGQLFNDTRFPNATLRFELQSGLTNKIEFENGVVSITVESASLLNWAQTDEITVALSFNSGQDKKLSILVEKDMKE